jgi:hypothetical protein
MPILLFLTLTWLTVPSSAHSAQPDLLIERITRFSSELERLTQDFTASDLVIFDLDNTVFREVQMLGTDEWYTDEIKTLREELGLSREEAALRLEDLNMAVKSASRTKLMEPEIPGLIAQLQTRGVRVIALTARHPNLAPSTQRHLAQFGIDFSRTAPPCGNLPDVKYQKGVLFTAGATKGKVLSGFLAKAGFSPRRVAALDDRIHHLNSYVETLQEVGIEGRLIHYLRVNEERPYDSRIGRFQAKYFLATGVILSDHEVEAAMAVDSCSKSLRAVNRSSFTKRRPDSAKGLPKSEF